MQVTTKFLHRAHLNTLILHFILPCQQPGATCNKRRHESDSSPQQRKRTRPSPDTNSDMDIESGNSSSYSLFSAGKSLYIFNVCLNLLEHKVVFYNKLTVIF